MHLFLVFNMSLLTFFFLNEVCNLGKWYPIVIQSTFSVSLDLTQSMEMCRATSEFKTTR